MGLGNLKRWSHPTWHLFHGMAEQISEDFFNKNRQHVIRIYKDICCNLPCPYCRNHAKLYIRSHKIEKIKSKKELKDFFFEFHNSVNARTSGKREDENILNRYKMMNVEVALHLFMQNFFRPYYVAHDFGSWRKSGLETYLNKYFKENWNKMFIGIRNPYKN